MGRAAIVTHVINGEYRGRYHSGFDEHGKQITSVTGICKPEDMIKTPLDEMELTGVGDALSSLPVISKTAALSLDKLCKVYDSTKTFCEVCNLKDCTCDFDDYESACFNHDDYL